jgi:hypothetical protein
METPRFYEKDLPDSIVMFNDHGSLRFSDLGKTENTMNIAIENMDEPLELITDSIELNKVFVFVERFFNRREFADIADQLNLTEHCVRDHWDRAVRDIEVLIQVLDTRGHATKQMRKKTARWNKFTRDEKAFLLMDIFGFNTMETAEILGFNPNLIHRIARRLEIKYRAAFDAVEEPA